MRKARIGLYSVGLEAYWGQFPSLKERLLGYNKHVSEQIEQWADVCNFGLVDSEQAGRMAGEYFQVNQVDLIFCHAATYCTSVSILPIHQICSAPVIFLNLQPTRQINYAETSTEEWLAHCGACPVPEFANAFHRANIPYHVVNGLLGLWKTPSVSKANEVTAEEPEAIAAWKQIKEWTMAASVKRSLQYSSFGFLGNTYSGMLDMYSDFTMLQAQLGIHVDVLEIGDLKEQLEQVSDKEVEAKRAEIENVFTISDDSHSDPIAKKPTENQLNWAAKVAAAEEGLADQKNLDALTYYYHGAPGSEEEALQAGMIVGNSLLTAKHIPCAGEGDLKTNIAMKICDLLDAGGSFAEIVLTDYAEGTILLGHDGPFHIAIAKDKPILRGMGLYHGKQGTGVAVEAKVKAGPITTLNVTQTVEGKVKFIISEGKAIDGPIMQIGNTQTHISFDEHPDAYMTRWFKEAPTHHCALAIGHIASQLEKISILLDIEYVIL
ncbi:L-fucose/L-arabinose isomerase family protein [Terribacillus goriensis]|uniref:L-arabinose isomerase family protein n=1 Tax=Terribacillus saccharophilus TaxID=361277 RepID=UPI00398327C7